MRTIARLETGRLSAVLCLVVAAIAATALLMFLPTSSGDGYPTSGLPDSAESSQVTELLTQFPGADQTAGVLVWTRPAGTGRAALTDADQAAITERVAALAAISSTPQAVRPQLSDDKTAMLTAVPMPKLATSAETVDQADSLRTVARDNLPDGLQAQLTGGLGFQADTATAFAGADVRLLIITASVVALLLLITYRSPILWLVPLTVVALADAVARAVVGAVGERFDIPFDASILGILSVLVFGAGTNYALLLIARYREELLAEPDRRRAMRSAVRGAGPAILASGSTVILSLLTLLFAELSGTRALGLACAIGIAIALAFALLVLPAALVVCGRGLFWPFIPRADPDGQRRRAARPSIWARIGSGVARHPVWVSVASAALIGSFALGLQGASIGLSQTQQLLGNPESVQAEATIADTFGAGLTTPTTVLAPEAVAQEAADLAGSTPGVVAVRVGNTAAGYTNLSLTLSGTPQSAANFTTITELRTTYSEASGPVSGALVGGSDATALDVRTAAAADRALIIPLILGVVFAVLLVLLRSLVAPFLLIATVVGTYVASLGLGNWLFQNVFDFPAFDTQVVLYSFLFLVALGVDYNIFLTTRAREERPAYGTRDGMRRALTSTGGVITSAGVLLAAVFVVLGVLPVVALAQIGAIVCIGVLLDTLVVRTLLVPALVFLTGDAFWWPSKKPSAHVSPVDERSVATADRA